MNTKANNNTNNNNNNNNKKTITIIASTPFLRSLRWIVSDSLILHIRC